jgi:hypothetical protein
MTVPNAIWSGLTAEWLWYSFGAAVGIILASFMIAFVAFNLWGPVIKAARKPEDVKSVTPDTVKKP